jgi:hypothetical protein
VFTPSFLNWFKVKLNNYIFITLHAIRRLGISSWPLGAIGIGIPWRAINLAQYKGVKTFAVGLTKLVAHSTLMGCPGWPDFECFILMMENPTINIHWPSLSKFWLCNEQVFQIKNMLKNIVPVRFLRLFSINLIAERFRLIEGRQCKTINHIV